MIGIILLFSSALIIYIKNKVTQTTPSPTVIQNTPEELTGMKKYIEDCVISTAKDAILQIGAHGGYIYPNRNGISANPIDSTEGTGVEIMPGTNTLVPYWYYLSTRNNCKDNCAFDSKMPFLTESEAQGSISIEKQVADYVTANFRTCLNNLTVYKNMGYEIKEITPPKTKVTVTLEDVVVDTTWPIEAGRDPNKLGRIDKFVVRLPVNLRQIYDFAKEIRDYEIENTFFEAHTLNLITYYADKNEDRLPPLAVYTFIKTTAPTWRLDSVKNQVSSILSLYVPLLGIKNTLNGISFAYPKEMEMTQTVMDKMLLSLNDTNYHPLNVEFRYSQNWPIYFDITPRNGQIIKPKDILGGFGVLGILGVDMKQYEFQYDVSYPVIITLNDPKSYNDEGYSFFFALESNVRNNKQLQADFKPMSMSGTTKTFVCDEEQKKSGNVTINSFNKVTNSPIEDVSISFSLGGQGCDVGSTRKENSTSNKSYFKDNLPTGIGKLIFSKQDYISTSMLYHATEGKNDILNVSLYPIVPKNVSIKVYHVEKGYYYVNDTHAGYYCVPLGWKFNSTPQNIRQNETVEINIRKVKTPESSDDLFSSLFFKGSNVGLINGSMPVMNESQLTAEEKKQLRENSQNTINYVGMVNSRNLSIGPGSYWVFISTTLNENLTIPRQILKIKADGDTVTLDLPEKSIYPFMEGMLTLDNSTNSFYFEVKPEDLYTNKTLEFYALAYDLKSVPMDCRRHYITSDFFPDPKIEDITKNNKLLLTPKFIQK